MNQTLPRLDQDLFSTDDLREIGAFFHGQGKALKSAILFNEALVREPAHAETMANLGAALMDADRDSESVASLDGALALDRDCILAWINKGAYHRRIGEFEEAKRCYSRVLALNPPFLDTIYNFLGMTEQTQGNIEAATQCFQSALNLNPANTAAEMNLGIMQLLCGNYAEGFWHYEARLKIHQIPWPLPKVSVFDRENIPAIGCGARLLVIKEQGMGDTFQFARYGVALKTVFPDAELHLTLLAGDDMAGALRMWGGWDRVVSPRDGEIFDKDYDLQIALMSIPMWLQRMVHDPIFTNSYRWNNIFVAPRKATRKYIGLAWRGNPNHPADKYRSLSIEHLKPLLSTGNDFMSFQYAPTPDEAAVVTQQADLRNWTSTENELRNHCKLLITCDTAIAHLAGSMCIPVWLMVAYVPDWRWGLTGETTPWYPTVRIFRQKKLGDWDGVIQDVVEALNDNP